MYSEISRINSAGISSLSNRYETAFCRDTKLLILDEPASPLDPLMRDKLCELICDYLNSEDSIANTINKIRNIEGGAGVVFTPVNGLIDMCLGVSGTFNIKGLDKPFQGIGVELGTILNLWRFPITVFMHEADLFGERHLCVDFGIGFHLGEFEKSKNSYQ